MRVAPGLSIYSLLNLAKAPKPLPSIGSHHKDRYIKCPWDSLLISKDVRRVKCPKTLLYRSSNRLYKIYTFILGGSTKLDRNTSLSPKALIYLTQKALVCPFRVSGKHNG